jgi:NAD(P)-dependent dehydrogenase (short-subunit alcohol dehydrogenase family)
VKRELTGALCAVTGASSGIGAATARALAARGAGVVSFARRFRRYAPWRVPRAGEILEVALDVTDEERVRACFAELQEIEVLVHAAGAGSFKPLRLAEAAELRQMLDVHVVGTFLASREAARAMTARRSGHIVSVSSVAAVRAFSDTGGYSAAKAGQLGLTRVLAEELRASDVRVTALLLGATDTPMWDARPGFDRARMMDADQVAGLIVDLVERPALAAEEVVVVPPGGNL